jgi:hypothetical protein
MKELNFDMVFYNLIVNNTIRNRNAIKLMNFIKKCLILCFGIISLKNSFESFYS